MKKLCMLLTLLLTIMFVQTSWASYYEVELDGLADIAGFGVDIITAQSDPDIADFTVTTSLSGWWVWPASSPTLGAQGMNMMGADIDASSSPVTAFTISAAYDFSLDLDSFLMTITGGGEISTPYYASFDGAEKYTVRPGAATVPIPGAVWMLGSGLLGLVTIRRRRG